MILRRHVPSTRGTGMGRAERRAFRRAYGKPGGTHTYAEYQLLVRYETALRQVRAWRSR